MQKLFLALGLLLFIAPAAHAHSITKEDVMKAQDAWAAGIVNISKAYIDKGDYKAVAKKHIEDLYAYGKTEVLFKPTLAADDQFRETFDEAQHIAIYGDYAVSMGNYFFTPADGGAEQKVEFTFGYIKDANGDLRINVHHSSLPFMAK